MKKSYIKLLIFIFIFTLIFFLNSFVFKILTTPFLCLFILFLIVIVYFTFGIEKDRHRYAKNIILEILITLIIFFLLYYLSGIIIGFAKTNYLTLSGLIKFIIPLIIYIILKEFLRYQLVMKASEEKKLIILVCIFFIILDCTVPFSAHVLGANRETFLLVALTLFPSITENILCTYLCLNFGYLPSMFYLLIIKLYIYIMPIIPNPSEFVYSIIFFLIPLIVMVKVKKWLKKDKTEVVILESYKKKKKELLYYIPLIIITLLLVYVISGYFRYYAIAIASGSMETVISKGDVVIVDQKYKKINKKDIIAYNYEGKVVVHRIYKIIDTKDEYFVYTKGDANSDYDQYKISKDMVIGVVKFKIPFIGYPTVRLNEIW